MRLTLLTLFAVTCLSACGQPQNTKSKPTMSSSSDKLQTIYLGEGCFWCTEAFFQRINGVISVESGTHVFGAAPFEYSLYGYGCANFEHDPAHTLFYNALPTKL